MDIQIASGPSGASDTLVFLIARQQDVVLPIAASAVIAAGAAQARFVGEAGSSFESFADVEGITRRVVLIGVGGAQEADIERAGGALVAKLLASGAVEASVSFALLNIVSERAIARFAFGAQLRSWRIDRYRTKLPAKQRPTLERVVLVTEAPLVQPLWESQQAVAKGVAFTRELVAEPGNVIYPETFVERCQHLREIGVELTILDESEMARLGMGALLGVAQGSARKPRVLAMKWDGTQTAEGTEPQKPLVLIGKGVTFDSGGISLKPGPGMEDMKWDMGGAGAVAGTMMALAGRKAKAHVIGICGLVENMPDGNAQRPGDIVTSMSGQTIEVLNTDAEGRLVLCDVLTWAQRTYSPETVIDLATLTGAMMVALGDQHGGLFSNDDGLADDLLNAGKASGDLLWRFPLSDAYDKMIDSPIADMKNIGGRFAGSITAAQFIKRFVEDGVKWAHLDIAGMVWADKPGAFWEKGATGYGVRLLDRLVADKFEG
jgi:leucyl aminopeptidase